MLKGETGGFTTHHKSYQGETDVWLTPPEIISGLGQFDLDPCACADPRPWDTAKEHYSLPQDGLLLPWNGRVWMNPPYGPETGKWLKKLSEHGNGIALIFARTETKMFQDYAFGRAEAIFFFGRRLTFFTPEGVVGPKNSGAPSALIAYGTENVSALERFGFPGTLVTGWTKK